MRTQKITKDKMKSIIEKNKYTRPQNYCGPDYPTTISVVGQSRDSGLLEQSNFRSALELLGGESETVLVVRDSHWAVGWVETLRVELSDKVAIKKACEILAALENYPVVDDDDYSELQYEYFYNYAKNAAPSVAAVLVKVFGLDESLTENEEFLSVCTELNVFHQESAGEDSALMNNPYHITELDDRDTKEYIRALEDIISNHGEYYKDNESFKLIAACFGMEF